MRRVMLLALLTGFLFALSVPTATGDGALERSDPFSGAWESTDIDGSQQVLIIKANPSRPGRYRVYIGDDGASICGVDAHGQPLYAGVGFGNGIVVRRTLRVRFEFWCLGSPPTSVDVGRVVYRYKASTDTLRDNWDVEWHRL